MKGLFLKDLYMTAKYCKAFLVIIVVFMAASFFGDANILFIVYPTMIAGIIPMTLISYDERDKWNQYSGTLPYSEVQLVSSKYLIGLLFGSLAYLVSIVATVIRMLLKGYFSVEEFLMIATILLILGMIGPTVLLPFVFKFGAEKGRIAFYVMVGLVCAVSTLLMGFGIQTVLPMGNRWMLSVIAGVVVLLYGISWYLSILFYRAREF